MHYRPRESRRWGAFICTLLSTSGSNIGPETLVHSMLKDSTRMYRHHVEHQKMGLIMQSKMETLLLGDSNDLQEAEWMQLVGCGLRSSMQRMSQSFGRYANHWLHVHWSHLSPNSEPTLPGNFQQSESRMKLRRELTSTRLGWLNSITGYNKILEEVKLEVRYHARRSGCSRRLRASPCSAGASRSASLECALQI
ncbi:putative ORF3 protein [Human associated gemykibivirus 1]|uniref:Putative ORF3 protein n=1 Tax=Human associated gemykibivirus 1 TaxID=2004487 RepID=A0A0S2C4F9_9VIRU|nr:putative ORF3 protein [Human associated gemykibivirus 1]